MIGMTCSAKPVLREDLCVVQKEGFSVSHYMCDMYTWREETISGRGSQGAWHQDELIGGKPPVVALRVVGGSDQY
jgi:hypothetical protein